ncbi:HAD-IA family hydrolase [Streptomyces sp. NBC_00160]|uniref:HAD-IA family hydrolase n=1 Tax=Streptomyces sp. NBC_00160 TaxID=2903628 RepID=UPI00224E86C9|nr:HAD-IA family hydrolase [Streptomyces sp. NBC_00160]MCX5302804.1 HAD-IA family hydrolase [Streptomyces sp. NBC_00160]
MDFAVKASGCRRSLVLDSDDRAPAAARAFAHRTLSGWGLDDVLDRSLLIVSELTTNAERHGRTPANAPEPECERITVTLAVQGGVVGIEVEDNSPSPPVLQPSNPDDVGGRGLLLVEAEADYWTATPREDGLGKRVLAIVKRPTVDVADVSPPPSSDLTAGHRPGLISRRAAHMLLQPYEPPPEPSAPPRRALIFDLDGVLVDTLPVMRQAWQAVRDIHGITTPFEDYAAHLGRPFADIMGVLGISNVKEVHATYSAASIKAAPAASVFCGVHEALRAFAVGGWLLAVVTSKPLDRAAPLVARLSSPFAAIHTPSSRGRGKPSPDHLLLTLVDLGVDPADAVFVGDMPADREAAQRAGIRFVHASWGYGGPGTSDVEIARSPGHLVALLEAGPRPFFATAGDLQ